MGELARASEPVEPAKRERLAALSRPEGLALSPELIALRGLSDSEKLVYALLSAYPVDNLMGDRPTQEQMATFLGKSRTQFHAILRRLLRSGLVGQKRVGLNRANCYYVRPLSSLGPETSAKSERVTQAMAHAREAQRARVIADEQQPRLLEVEATLAAALAELKSALKVTFTKNETRRLCAEQGEREFEARVRQWSQHAGAIRRMVIDAARFAAKRLRDGEDVPEDMRASRGPGTGSVTRLHADIPDGTPLPVRRAIEAIVARVPRDYHYLLAELTWSDDASTATCARESDAKLVRTRVLPEAGLEHVVVTVNT